MLTNTITFLQSIRLFEVVFEVTNFDNVYAVTKNGDTTEKITRV